MTIKFFKPSHPTINSEESEVWFRDYCKTISIEQIDGDPSAYFVLALREAYTPETCELRIIVKHKNFFREHFVNYNEANEVISRIKEKAYGK